jgi:hypothetical protein
MDKDEDIILLKDRCEAISKDNVIVQVTRFLHVMEDSHLSVADKGEGSQINGENVFNLRIIGHKILSCYLYTIVNDPSAVLRQ